MILYVKPGTSGNCNSWATACELQTALGQAFYGDEIWVAAGTYKPTTGSDRNATFALPNGVGVYGGFAGTETAAQSAQLDDECHHTQRRHRHDRE